MTIGACAQWWGLIEYEQAWSRQLTLVEDRIAGRCLDTFVFCVHPPVITSGRASQRMEGQSSPAQSEIAVLPVERGGHLTYHGPGQLVVYPILKLGRTQQHSSRQGVVSLIRAMEAWLMDALATYGVVAESIEGKTGVWVLGGQRKIASIGIAARHWVSYHGLAINLDVPAEPWRLIQPCGFESSVMVDLKELIRKSISEKEFADLLLSIAPKHFGDDVSWSDAEQK